MYIVTATKMARMPARTPTPPISDESILAKMRTAPKEVSFLILSRSKALCSGDGDVVFETIKPSRQTALALAFRSRQPIAAVWRERFKVAADMGGSALEHAVAAIIQSYAPSLHNADSKYDLSGHKYRRATAPAARSSHRDSQLSSRSGELARKITDLLFLSVFFRTRPFANANAPPNRTNHSGKPRNSRR